MWKETKVFKNVSQYNFDARYGVYATTDKIKDAKSLYKVLEDEKQFKKNFNFVEDLEK